MMTRNTNETAQSPVQGVMWSLLQNGGRQIVSYTVFAVLAHLLAPAVFGVVAMALIFTAFVEIFIEQGFTEAIVQRSRLKPTHLDTAFWANLAFGGACTAVGIVAAPLVAWLFDQSQLTLVVRWLSLLFIINALGTVQYALLWRRMAFKALAFRMLGGVSIGGGVCIAMAVAGYGVWALVAQALLTAIVNTALLWRLSDWRPRLRFSMVRLRQLMRMGVPIIAHNVVNFFNRRSDDLLIGIFLGATALGYYTVAYRILLLMTRLLSHTVGRVTFPKLSNLQDDRNELQRTYLRATRMSVLVSFPLFALVGGLGDPLVALLFGEKWSSAVPALRALMVTGAIQMLIIINAALLAACGRMGWRLAFTCAYAVMNIGAFALAVRWGITGVACAYALTTALMLPVSVSLVRRLIPISVGHYIALLAYPALGSAFVGAAAWGITVAFGDALNVFLLLIATTIIAAAAYVGVGTIVAPSAFSSLYGAGINLVRPRCEVQGVK